ncbi:MAG: hypothetical protein B6I24_10095 [Bacteroidetes bacterium 4572_128]|nr:MAG: hypothetical protein B6I24_10095 [Bacteroidetes bacterium 4572_128]
MRIDFFKEDCHGSCFNDKEVGVCDDQESTKAYINKENKEKWIATIKNLKSKIIDFYAIDNCIEIYRENNDKDNKCDAMLIYENGIIFIELKDKRADWIPDAIGQLENTIKYFIENHGIEQFNIKKAFACNKRKPNFQTINMQIKQSFYQKWKVRLHIEATIKIQ